ncbi:hypothetical protein [Nocardia jiangxiensis]|uniref:VOC domain-containing protein n=1 Tax=Nocardia jiangxiensis TaxID=282685 RepID=A0ABW6S535_9NOCA|nr:hypothetical protein [Nocardia jiangxiensis]
MPTALHLFAGIPVADFRTAVTWYEKLLAKTETYDNGVRKITYTDPDGNEIGFGQVPG